MKLLPSKTNLLVILAVVVVVKFAILPLYEFQNQQNEILIGKNRQLAKLQMLLEEKDLLKSSSQAVNNAIDASISRFYDDSGTVKLDLQRQVEEVFDRHLVVMNSFDWISDSNQIVRTLRASVRFSGKTTDVITAFWDISRMSSAVKIVSWRQRILGNQGDSMGSSQGDLTVEFYAVKSTTSMDLSAHSQAAE